MENLILIQYIFLSGCTAHTINNDVNGEAIKVI